MMGRDHVTVGACTVCIGAAAQAIPWAQPKLAVLAVGLVLFGNLAPDWDHPKAGVTRSWGWASRFIGWLIRRLARGVYLATRTTHDPRGRAIHRTATHTWPAAIVAGAAVATVVSTTPPWVATLCMAMATGSAGFGYDKGLRPYAAVAGGAATWPLATSGELASGHSYVVLGLATAIGCLTHCLADCTTKMGNPWAFPRVSIVKTLRKDGTVIERRQRWYCSGPPAWLRYETGERTEKWVVRGIVVFSLVVSWWLVSYVSMPHFFY